MGNVNKTATAVAYCKVHHKLLYTDRKRARNIAKQHPQHKNVYRCEEHDGLWHIGALPIEIKHGHISKEDFYRNRRAA
jgi:hypothetical protein